MTVKFVRTCQECGNRQVDKKPPDPALISDAYSYRKCKKCKSEALDYGSDQEVDENLKPLDVDYETGYPVERK